MHNRDGGEDRTTTGQLGKLTAKSAIDIAIAEGDVIAPHPLSAVARESSSGLDLELRVIAPWGQRSEILSLYTSSPYVFTNKCRSLWARLVRDLRYAQHLQDSPRDGKAVTEVAAS